MTTTQSGPVCATEGANEKCVCVCITSISCEYRNTFFYCFSLMCSSYVGKRRPHNTPPSNGAYQCRVRSLTLYDLDLPHVCQKTTNVFYAQQSGELPYDTHIVCTLQRSRYVISVAEYVYPPDLILRSMIPIYQQNDMPLFRACMRHL